MAAGAPRSTTWSRVTWLPSVLANAPGTGSTDSASGDPSSGTSKWRNIGLPTEERLVQQEQIECHDRARDQGGDDGGRTAIDQRSHDPALAGEPHQRDERERQPEAQHHLAKDQGAGGIPTGPDHE